jgi:hypothetical protein
MVLQWSPISLAALVGVTSVAAAASAFVVARSQTRRPVAAVERPT